MNFTAPAFVLLFPIVLALHWMLPPSRRWVLLLAASLGFYAVGSPQALPLLAGITLGTYAAALGIAKSKTQTAKKLWLTCAAILCIGCLCLFKYAGIFRTDVPLLLPAGISFYTFQTLSYVVDIYRGRLMPERHPGYYALFVSFFPQLVAGPIERSTALLPQLHAQERRMDSSGWLAVANAEDIDTYADYLQSQLTAPLAGDPHACVMDAGWFYDTNFHLNVSGKTVFTRQLIRDLKAVLGDTSSTEIALPAMPARRIQTDTEAANNSDAAYFTWESDRLVVNAAGRGRRTLTVPGEVDGRPVTALASDTFAGCSALEKLTIQQNITALPDGLFAKCPALQEITLTQPDPARLSVGQALLDGAPAFCRIRVPATSYTSYCLSYAWSPYAETFVH